MPDLKQLRREARARRRALSGREQRAHSRACARLLRGGGLLLPARRVAAYVAADGELDPAPLFTTLQSRRRRLYLPVLRPGPKLWFIAHPREGVLRNNRYGIPEPPLRHVHACPPWALDLVLLPLVAFDADCNRLGMGAGYYDRSLAYLRQRRHWRKPRLVGLAHECQRVERLPARPWDIPLDMVVTERRSYRRSDALQGSGRAAEDGSGG